MLRREGLNVSRSLFSRIEMNLLTHVLSIVYCYLYVLLCSRFPNHVLYPINHKKRFAEM